MSGDRSKVVKTRFERPCIAKQLQRTFLGVQNISAPSPEHVLGGERLSGGAVGNSADAQKLPSPEAFNRERPAWTRML